MIAGAMVVIALNVYVTTRLLLKVEFNQHQKVVQSIIIWAQLLKRVFDIDIERCACGGKLKRIAVIEEPAVIGKILTHIGLDPQPPPRAPARRVDLFQGFEAA